MPKDAGDTNLSDVLSRIRGVSGTALAPGDRLVGCRQAAGSNNCDSRLRTIDGLGELPDCPAATALRAYLRGSTRLTLVEDWVDSVLGEEGRSRCFGPTAVTRAGRRLNVLHVMDSDLPCDGQLWYAGSFIIALISRAQSPQREMFTMAHELGHAALYMVDPEVDQNDAGVDKICNIFATELIMPTKLVRNIWHSTPDAGAVMQIKNKCSASLPASCLRVAEYLGDATVGIVSDRGIIQHWYGVIPGREIKSALDRLTFGKSLEGKSSIDLPGGLTLSLRRVGKERAIFLARKIA